MKTEHRVPPMIRCPYCQPGIVSYAGRVISRVCPDCRQELAEAAENRDGVEALDARVRAYKAGITASRLS